MAQYIDLTYVTDLVGDRFSFGTSGNNYITENQGTKLIQRAMELIDFKLQNVYGTTSPLFGTNSLGTSIVPPIIQQICGYMTAGLCIYNTSLHTIESNREWGTNMYMHGFSLLENLITGEAEAVPFNGTLSGGQSPASGGEYTKVRGEVVHMSGTNLHALNYMSVIYGSEKVYAVNDGTSPQVFRRGSDYELFYFNEDLTGTNSGRIRRMSTGSITDGDNVRIDYTYINSPYFAVNDNLKWGEASIENRGKK
jgi:hypothetical protein